MNEYYLMCGFGFYWVVNKLASVFEMNKTFIVIETYLVTAKNIDAVTTQFFAQVTH